MAPSEPLASHQFDPDHPEEALAFLKRTRSELRELRSVRVFRKRLQIIDVNGEYFEVLGVGFPSPAICLLLDALSAAYRRETIHEETDRDYKEFKTGRRYPWAADRVM